jgi:hypothetical protein
MFILVSGALEPGVHMRMILIFLLLAGFVFAPTTLRTCEKECCDNNGGTWDYTDEYCDIDYNGPGGSSYVSCADDCWESQYSYSADYSCCGPAVLLLAIAGFALRQ